MNRFTLTALAAVVAATSVADTQSARFVLETHPVQPLRGDRTLSVMFKLDTVSGDIWRFSGSDFVRIPVANTWSAGVDRTSRDDIEKQRRRAALLKKMDDIVIPEIDFRQAKLHDALEFLQEASVKHDAEKRGMSFILKLGGSSPQANVNDPFAEPDTSEDAWEPLITFSARDITLHEAIDIITDVAGLRYRIEGGVVVIVPYACHMGQLEYRLYDLLPSTVEKLQNYQPELFSTNLPPAVAEDRWKLFFSELGVTWPSSASINPVPLIGKVVVCNTYQNLVSFEQIMETINSYPSRPNRFRLMLAAGASPAALFLIDSDTGHTWQYEVSELAENGNTIQSDSFLSIQERKRTPNPKVDTPTESDLSGEGALSDGNGVAEPKTTENEAQRGVIEHQPEC
jgi:hypothetical protein